MKASTQTSAKQSVKRDDSLTPSRAQHATPATSSPARRPRRSGAHIQPASDRERIMKAFLADFAATGNVSAACRNAGISRDVIYTWRKDNAQFAARWAIAEEDAIDVLRAAAHDRAVTGWEEPAISAGRWVTDPEGVPVMVRKYSDALLQSMLKARAPEYKDRTSVELTGANGGPIETNVLFILPEIVDVAPLPPGITVDADADSALTARKKSTHGRSTPPATPKARREGASKRQAS